ncbi:hypothetical protein O6H91_08G016600 [Diphasiastrum complanatum]|uniref:Uncharacterized protein n=1 Tax=Diphasiastrum complanatum TaxID=34168 RepID=A0ACC2CV85_DIPCM|nr:hypothetical protein O6H91_08G016600 [Diphasiastrum complanatum]
MQEQLQINNVDHKDNGSYPVGNLLSAKRTGVTPSMSCGTVCQLSVPDNQATDAEARSTAARKLSFAIIFCLVFMGVEVAGGLLASSLAILTDAAHLLSDVAGFAISLFSIWAAGWEATPRQTYGFHRLEILGALVSIQIIWLLTGILVYEAVDRILHKSQPVDGRLMFLTATLGLLVNLAMILILGHGHGHGHKHDHSHGHDHDHVHELEHGHANEQGLEHSCRKLYVTGYDHETPKNHSHDHDHSSPHHAKHVDISCARGTETFSSNPANPCSEDRQLLQTARSLKFDQDLDRCGIDSVENINIRGAYLHALGDLIQSIGVMVAGAVIWYNPEWRIVDLACTLLFSLLVLGTTIKMLMDIIDVLMESTPREIDTTKLEEGLRDIPKVVAVHELHIWAITVGKTLLACHVRIQPDANADAVLRKVVQFCSSKFKISHVTVQIERDLED